MRYLVGLCFRNHGHLLQSSEKTHYSITGFRKLPLVLLSHTGAHEPTCREPTGSIPSPAPQTEPQRAAGSGWRAASPDTDSGKGTPDLLQPEGASGACPPLQMRGCTARLRSQTPWHRGHYWGCQGREGLAPSHEALPEMRLLTQLTEVRGHRPGTCGVRGSTQPTPGQLRARAQAGHDRAQVWPAGHAQQHTAHAQPARGMGCVGAGHHHPA